jgi:hypothetical protein
MYERFRVEHYSIVVAKTILLIRLRAEINLIEDQNDVFLRRTHPNQNLRN